MDGTSYSQGSPYSCQNQYYNLPSGWELAPPDSDGVRIATVGGWGTQVVVYSGGTAYGTSNYNPGLFSGSWLDTSTLNGAPAYKPLGCNLRVLMRAPSACACKLPGGDTTATCTNEYSGVSVRCGLWGTADNGDTRCDLPEFRTAITAPNFHRLYTGTDTGQCRTRSYETWCYIATGISDNVNVAMTTSGPTGYNGHQLRMNCGSTAAQVPSIDGIGIWYYATQSTNNQYFDRITCTQFA